MVTTFSLSNISIYSTTSFRPIVICSTTFTMVLKFRIAPIMDILLLPFDLTIRTMRPLIVGFSYLVNIVVWIDCWKDVVECSLYFLLFQLLTL